MATLESKRATWNGDHVVIDAELTIREVTRPVRLHGQLVAARALRHGRQTELRAGYQLETTLDRRAFGLTFPGAIEAAPIAAAPLARAAQLASYTVALEVNVEIVRRVSPLAEVLPRPTGMR